ncbi:MAG: hypothetical protein PHN41_04895 [Bacteroidales bacterium]|jgi:hypothetical protein|nr:hypothetical protein [Bacteroidales bacterium]MDD4068464.1 hypothetical protein [Bacteroidales bacterium]MDD4703714.1 hypothetical protein [Bacteroidales bacterium]MDX9799537.1 hypothetical protein [Bacteroidales bacterium]
MKTKNLLRVVAIFVITALSLSFFSACEEKEENPLIGEWVSTTENYAYGETIVFTSDGKIEKWAGLTYNPVDSSYAPAQYKVSNNTIDITKGGQTLSFKYSINNSNLTIYRLGYSFTILAVEWQNVTFKKVK